MISQKVIPMTGDQAQNQLNNSGTAENDILSTNSPDQLVWYMRIPQVAAIVSFLELLSYERLKDLMRYFLDSASFDISIKVIRVGT